MISHEEAAMQNGVKLSLQADMVNNPPHYKDASGIECIEVTKHMGFCGGNCFKYLYRAGKKGLMIEDLKKAAWYSERAWLGNEDISEYIARLILQVARHRKGNILSAMDAISGNDWYRAECYINDEIERLESEGNQ